MVAAGSGNQEQRGPFCLTLQGGVGVFATRNKSRFPGRELAKVYDFKLRSKELEVAEWRFYCFPVMVTG